MVLSFSSSLVFLDPNIGPTPSRVLLGVSLSVFEWLSIFSCTHRSVSSSLWQSCLVIDYPIRLLPAFFGSASSHALYLPLFSLVLISPDGCGSTSLFFVCYCCSWYISFVLFPWCVSLLHLIIYPEGLGPFLFLIVWSLDRSHFDSAHILDIVVSDHLFCNQPSMSNIVCCVFISVHAFLWRLVASAYKIC